MSYDFRIKCATPPSKGEVATAAGPEAVRSDEEQSPGSNWTASPLRLWIPGQSTRWTEVSYAEGEFAVTIRHGATVEDRVLASRIAGWLATRCERNIVYAECAPVPLAELPERYGPEWAEMSEESDLKSLIALVTGRLENIKGELVNLVQKGPIAVPGPLGAFHLGPRLIEALQGRAGDTELWLKLKRCMLDFHDPAVPHATLFNTEGRPGEKASTFVIWYPDKTEVVSKADYVLLDVEPPAIMPWDEFLKLAAGRSKLIDEDQPLVGACGADDWPTIISKARSMDVSQELKAKLNEPQALSTSQGKARFTSKLGTVMGILLIFAGAISMMTVGVGVGILLVIAGLACGSNLVLMGLRLIPFIRAKKPLKK